MLHLHRAVGFGNRDRLQHGNDFIAAALKPRRQQQVLAEFGVRLVARESAFGGGGAFGQDTGWRAAIDRVKVIPVLDLAEQSV